MRVKFFAPSQKQVDNRVVIAERVERSGQRVRCPLVGHCWSPNNPCTDARRKPALLVGYFFSGSQKCPSVVYFSVFEYSKLDQGGNQPLPYYPSLHDSKQEEDYGSSYGVYWRRGNDSLHDEPNVC